MVTEQPVLVQRPSISSTGHPVLPGVQDPTSVPAGLMIVMILVPEVALRMKWVA